MIPEFIDGVARKWLQRRMFGTTVTKAGFHGDAAIKSGESPEPTDRVNEAYLLVARIEHGGETLVASYSYEIGWHPIVFTSYERLQNWLNGPASDIYREGDSPETYILAFQDDGEVLFRLRGPEDESPPLHRRDGRDG